MSYESVAGRSTAPAFSSFSSRGRTNNNNNNNLITSLRSIHRDRGTNAWFEEIAQAAEAEGDAAFTRPRAPLFERSARPHFFSAEERRRMDNYESIDYSEAQSLTYKAQMTQRKKERRWLKWVVFIAVGICVGLWSVLLFQTLEFLSVEKLKLVENFINSHANSNNNNNNSSVDSSSNANNNNNIEIIYEGKISEGISWKILGEGYLIHIGWSALAALLSSLCCLIIPTAAGSGIPDVMAYLNGIMFPRIFNIRNLIIKTLSCILAVSSGLPVGAEGPIIHIGSLIGAGLPTGRSRTLRCSASSLLSTFRNPRDMRDFISAGAACGMTSAFSAPIGGLLFVMEEMATFFPVKLACLVFVSCLSCMCVIQIINTYLTGWRPTIHLGGESGEFKPSAIAMFIVDTVPGNRVPMNFLTFIPTIIGAIILGLLAVSYTVSSVRFTRWRSKKLFPHTLLRVLEPCIFALLYGTICYMLPLAFNCIEIPSYVQEHKEELNIELVTAFCSNHENYFSPLATLTLTSPYNAIRILFSRHTNALTPWYACLLHLIIYLIGSSYAGGMFISCGTVIPSLLIGAVGGRLIGVILNNNVWADPGVIALIGSASYFSGISRLSFSLIVIMMELTADLTHITCLMIGVIIARAVANRWCHSLYHSLLEVKAAPFLEAQASMHKLDMFCAKHIMTSPAITLETLEPVNKIIEILQTTPHNSFPVISSTRGTYDGVIARSQLELLLWFIYFRDAEGMCEGEIDNGKMHPSIQKKKEEIKEKYKDKLKTNDNDKNTFSTSPNSINTMPNNNNNNNNNNGTTNSLNISNDEAIERLSKQPHATYKDLKEVSERIFWRRLPSLPPMELLPTTTLNCFVDLSPYVDLSSYYVRDVMCISRAYYIFRHLGLRQLPVVDRNHHVVGVISRKNFVGDRLHERLRFAEELENQAADARAQRLFRKQE